MLHRCRSSLRGNLRIDVTRCSRGLRGGSEAVGLQVVAGRLLTFCTVIVNVCAALVSTPPFVVPPFSLSTTDTVVEPVAPAAVVKVSAPLAAIAGCSENRRLLSF